MKVGTKSARQTELETTGALSAVFLILGVVAGSRTYLYISLFLLLTGLFVPSCARVIANVWLRLAEKIGSFNSRIILLLVYYLVLTPLAYCYRLSGRDSLKLKNREMRSNYQERNQTYSREDFLKTW